MVGFEVSILVGMDPSMKHHSLKLLKLTPLNREGQCQVGSFGGVLAS